MSDDDLLISFEDGSLPLAHWNHRAHVRVAFLYLTQFGLSEAIDRMRSGIKAYNAVHGVEEGPSTGYHETTTQAFMRLIHQALRKRGPFQDSQGFCERNSELLDRRVLLCYYTRDRVMDPAAKIGFVEPDVAPLDRIGLSFPEFGKRIEDATYTLRPASYGVISNGAGRIAVVCTSDGTHLPGGSQFPDEPAVHALRREALEGCGLEIEIGRPIGVADELVPAAENQQPCCRRSSFYTAAVVGTSSHAESERLLEWLASDRALERLSPTSHCWAVSRRRAGGSEHGAD